MPSPRKIDMLPEDVRRELDAEIISRGFSGYEDLSTWLEGKGYEIGKSTVAVHGRNLKLERQIARVRAATLASQALEDGSKDEADSRSNAIYAQFQTGVFDALGAVLEAEEEDDPAKKLLLLTKAGKDFAAIGRGNIARQRHAAEVRAKVEAAAADVRKLAAGAGVSEETLAAIDARLQGVV